jgi:hypothetical protein
MKTIILLISLLLVSLQSCAVTVPAMGFYYMSQETENPAHNKEWSSKVYREAMENRERKRKELARLRAEWDNCYMNNIVYKNPRYYL